jgi:hypothetical protein
MGARWAALALCLAVGCADRPPTSVASRELETVPHPELVEVRPSLIPGAGLGLFATADIPDGTYLGYYSGTYLAPDVSGAPHVTYLFILPDCAQDETHDRIAGDSEHYVSKVNFAPEKINGHDTRLQSTTFYEYCEEPFIRLFSTRAIALDEEVYTDYGPDYDYEFMDRDEVQQHFLRVTGIAPRPTFEWDYAKSR